MNTRLPLFIALIATTVPGVFSANDRANSPQPDWVEVQELLASDGTAHDDFGRCAALDGNTALIAAPDDASGRGAVYVFIRNGNTWIQQQKLVATDGVANDQFGHNLALDGDTALIGAFSADGGQGSAYVFTRTGAVWHEQQKLVAADRDGQPDYFGWFIAVDGDTAFIGAEADDNNAGSAYVFTRTGATWTQQQKLLDPEGQSEDRFGYQISLDGDTALIGAIYGDGMEPDSGTVHVFVRNGTTWIQRQEIFADDGAPGLTFGHSVSLDGDTALIGARFDLFHAGAAYVFTRTGKTWAQQQKLFSDGPYRDFGIFCSLEGDTALIGAWDEFGGSGAAYVFTRTGGFWAEQAELLPSDGAAGDMFGSAVVVQGDIALIGARRHDDNGVDSGSAYVFVNEAPNRPPVADFSWEPQHPYPRDVIIFDASASDDPDGNIVLYEWDWNNDGVYDESHLVPRAGHSFRRSGRYRVGLRVTDDDGAIDTRAKAVTVFR